MVRDDPFRALGIKPTHEHRGEWCRVCVAHGKAAAGIAMSRSVEELRAVADAAGPAVKAVRQMGTAGYPLWVLDRISKLEAALYALDSKEKP